LEWSIEDSNTGISGLTLRCYPSEQNRRKSSLEECIFDNMTLCFQCKNALLQTVLFWQFCPLGFTTQLAILNTNVGVIYLTSFLVNPSCIIILCFLRGFLNILYPLITDYSNPLVSVQELINSNWWSNKIIWEKATKPYLRSITSCWSVWPFGLVPFLWHPAHRSISTQFKHRFRLPLIFSWHPSHVITTSRSDEYRAMKRLMSRCLSTCACCRCKLHHSLIPIAFASLKYFWWRLYIFSSFSSSASFEGTVGPGTKNTKRFYDNVITNN